jgi:hypothetical protein
MRFTDGDFIAPGGPSGQGLSQGASVLCDLETFEVPEASSCPELVVVPVFSQ